MLCSRIDCFPDRARIKKTLVFGFFALQGNQNGPFFQNILGMTCSGRGKLVLLAKQQPCSRIHPSIYSRGDASQASPLPGALALLKSKLHGELWTSRVFFDETPDLFCFAQATGLPGTPPHLPESAMWQRSQQPFPSPTFLWLCTPHTTNSLQTSVPSTAHSGPKSGVSPTSAKTKQNKDFACLRSLRDAVHSSTAHGTLGHTLPLGWNKDIWRRGRGSPSSAA